MIWCPISSDATLDVPEFPMYATEANRGGARIKYQKIGPAKLALKNQMYGYSGLGTISIYKYSLQKHKYEKIFDSSSELAEAFRAKKLTRDELVGMIEW